jgi:PPOX class probable FMN-dependent enzyme
MNAAPARFSGLTDFVTNAAELREVIPPPLDVIVAKEIDHLDEICRSFIASSPFVVVATANASGRIDTSPKGDPAGFVRVLDDKHLAIPERPGNRRADTFRNVLENPQVGILFLIPGKGETLRICGEARIVRDRSLLESMSLKERSPALALVVHVERVFMHCPKCIIRSALWKPAKWPETAGLPSIGEAMVRHARLDVTPDELLARTAREGINALY